MAPRLLVSLAVVALTVATCDRPKGATLSTSSAPSTRPAEIPAVGTLTPATSADISAAAQFASDPAIQAAVNDRVGRSTAQWKIFAARPVGDYVLLWIDFPNVFDGGADLVYSKKEHRVSWEFKGGERG